jgi:hypothetical protein
MWCCGRLAYVSRILDIELKLNEFSRLWVMYTDIAHVDMIRVPVQLETIIYMKSNEKSTGYKEK